MPPRTPHLLALALLLPALAGCAPSRQARSVERSGFIDDYSQLEASGDDTRPLQPSRSAGSSSARAST